MNQGEKNEWVSSKKQLSQPETSPKGGSVNLLCVPSN